VPFSFGIPRSRHTLVRRQRLYDTLERGARAPVTLVSGPAGSGKTLLVASWLYDAPRRGPVIWVSVERGEHDATRFWRSIVDGLKVSGAAADVEAIQTLTPAPRGAGHEFVARLARGLGDLTRPVVLVVDDVHRLESADALDGLAALLAEVPRALHVILLSRRYPRLELHRLRVSGELTTISGADLAFTAGETRKLLSLAGIRVSEKSADRLCERTEGWAAGLRLAAMSLTSSPDRESFIERFSGGEHAIAEYLIGEVLDGQPPAVQRLLLRTSVLEHVNGDLAQLLAGQSDGERLLAQLEEANAFVTAVAAGSSWFRYHPLLADVLRRQLRLEAPADIDGLHRAAARWYAGHGFPVDAMRHAQTGHDWAYAAELLVEHWFSLALDGRRGTLHALLAALPREMMRTDAELATLLAADRLSAGTPQDADAYLDVADRLGESVAAGHRRRFDVALAVVKLSRARSRGDFDAAAANAHAILAPTADASHAKGLANEDMRAVALLNLGVVEQLALRLDEAESHLLDGVALARSIGRPYIAVGCLASAAGVANMRGQPGAAADRARQAIDLAERHGWSEDPIVGAAYLAMGGVLFAAGRFEESELWFERADRALRGTSDPDASVVLPTCLGALRFAQGRYIEAVAHLRDAERGCDALLASHYISTFATTWRLRAHIRLGDTGPAHLALADQGAWAGHLAEWCSLAADLHLAEDSPRKAVDALAPIFGGSAAAFSTSLTIDALVLEAIARRRLGEAAECERALERALDLAERQGRAWTLLIAPDLRPLLEQRARREPGRTFVAEILDRVKTVATRSPMGTAARLHPTLTPRELTVLRFLPTNLSAAEIASTMFLSVHTVKMHMRHLYAKLDVHRRTDAVECARDAGLLYRPPGSAH
jgi:LuxR family transcriptional regulator, maltose regulon positive regulatory protein